MAVAGRREVRVKMMPIGLENWRPLNNGNFVGVGGRGQAGERRGRRPGPRREGWTREAGSGHGCHVGDLQLRRQDEAGQSRSASNLSVYSLYTAQASRVYHSVDTEVLLMASSNSRGQRV